jgi:hypothetical protein
MEGCNTPAPTPAPRCRCINTVRKYLLDTLINESLDRCRTKVSYYSSDGFADLDEQVIVEPILEATLLQQQTAFRLAQYEDGKVPHAA